MSWVEHREAFEDILNLFLRLAIQISFVSLCIELSNSAFITHSSLIANMQMYKLNIDVQLQQDISEHDKVDFLLTPRNLTVFTDEDAVPNGTFDQVV